MYFKKLEKEDEKMLFDLIEKIENDLQDKKWWIIPTSKKEWKEVWKDCPFNDLLGVKR